MGISRSETYWYWSMSTTRSQETFTDQIFDQKEELQFLEKGILQKTCSARVCMTCQHFNYSNDKHCRTILSCHVHLRLIPHGDHFNSRWHLWIRQRERDWLVSIGSLRCWLDQFACMIFMWSLISLWTLFASSFLYFKGFVLTHLIWISYQCRNFLDKF